MGMYAVQAADSADLAVLGDAVRDSRAAAISRRRQLSQGKQALSAAGTLPAAENLQVNGAGAPTAPANGPAAPSGAQRAPEAKAVATNGVADAHLGRTLSVQRRRQM